MTEITMNPASENSDSDALEAEVKSLPGQMLLSARQAAGISIEEVARALKFSPRQVAALEADDYQILQGATFIRGFVRSYAKFLRLDPVPLLSLLEQTTPVRPAQVAVPANMGEASPKPFVERYQRTLLVVLLLLVVAAVGAYLYSREEGSPEEGAVAASAGGESQQNPVASPAPEPVAPATVATPPVVPVTTPEPMPATAAAPSPAAPPATPASSSVPAVPTPPAAPGAGERQIILDFESRTWVEIKDASNRIVLTGEYAAGAHQAASGKPPFKLWIGKASGVRVNYGDKRVDLTPYSRDDVARLTLE